MLAGLTITAAAHFFPGANTEASYSVIQPALAFQPTFSPPHHLRTQCPTFLRSVLTTQLSSRQNILTLHMSFMDDPSSNGNGKGGGGDGPPEKPPSDDFMPDFNEGPEPEENKQIRKQRADARLPISFRSDDGTRDEEFKLTNGEMPANEEEEDRNENSNEEENKNNKQSSSSSSGAMMPSNRFSIGGKQQPSGNANSSNIVKKSAENNPYLQVVSSLSPSEIISRFTLTAHPRVQDAAKQTILGLIGNLPKMAFDVNVVTTGKKLASLMFQLQMTGYMFKNAEYRMELSRQFSDVSALRNQFLLNGANDEEAEDNIYKVEEEDLDDNNVKSLKGKLRVKYGENLPEMEVDASAFTAELRTEVKRLKEELMTIQQEKNKPTEIIRQDLLAYIRTLPPQELQSLTSGMSEDILVAMKGLVNAVMMGIDQQQKEEEGEDDEIADSPPGITPDTIMEQSGEAMAQLCMWQLVVGYNLRELEVREEMKGALLSGSQNNNDSDGGDDDFFSPGLTTDKGGME